MANIFLRMVAHAALLSSFAGPVLAWDLPGHQSVGAVADVLLNPAARQAMQAMLGMSLHDASTWADCAKGVRPGQDGVLRYTVNKDHLYPECDIFETPEQIAAMEDFVRHNWDTCTLGRTCHTMYHATSIAWQRPRYGEWNGWSRYDVVHAIAAALEVLQGRPAPAPFYIPNKRVALMLLVHYVGDIHQPLHVGVAYVNPDGSLGDPAHATERPEDPGETVSGNRIMLGARDKSNLHGMWDSVPPQSITPDSAIVQRARQVPLTAGLPAAWAEAWANDSLALARDAFRTLRYTPGKQAGNPQVRWRADAPDDAEYVQAMHKVQHQQIAVAGAHLAQLLNALFAQPAA